MPRALHGYTHHNTHLIVVLWCAVEFNITICTIQIIIWIIFMLKSGARLTVLSNWTCICVCVLTTLFFLQLIQSHFHLYRSSHFCMRFIIVCHFMFIINYILNRITSIKHSPHFMFLMDNCFNCKLVD